MSASVLSQPCIERTVNQTIVRLEQGDLTAMEVDGVVYYAREDLQLGSGHGSAIQSRGGASIRKELEKIGSIRMGEAVVTAAGQLNAGHIIHACGPKFLEPDTGRKLRCCMLSALQAAAAGGLKRVAFPAMGAGFYGVPLDLCTRAMLETITEFARKDSSLGEIIICVVDNREFTAFKPRLEAL